MKDNRVQILKERLKEIDRNIKENKRLGVREYIRTLNNIGLESNYKELANLAAYFGYKDLQRYFINPAKAPEKLSVMRNIFKARLFQDYAPDDLRMN